VIEIYERLVCHQLALIMIHHGPEMGRYWRQTSTAMDWTWQKEEEEEKEEKEK